MLALLLTAGRSKRFWPLQDKSLTELCGKTLLEHQVERLKKGGVREIILVGGKHNLKQAKALLPTLKTIEQKHLDLGMRGALLSALPKFPDQPVMVVSSNDIIEPLGYRAITAQMENRKIDGVILARKVQSYFPGGYLKLKAKRVVGIIEKPKAGREPSKLVSIVAHAHHSSRTLLKALKEAKPTRDDGYELALNALFQTYRYEALSYVGTWQAIKYPWHLLQALPIFLADLRRQQVHPSATVHPSVVLSGPIILGKGVRVLPHATIIGPCYIGEGTIIGSNALVRQSSIGSRSVIGFASEIVRTLMGNNVWTHMTYLGDSVVADTVACGGGTLTGNLRLDEGEIASVVQEKKIPTGLQKFGSIIGENCRIGIHVSIAPGVKIGMGSFVDSATSLTADVPDGSFVKMEAGKQSIRFNRTPPLSPQARTGFWDMM